MSTIEAIKEMHGDETWKRFIRPLTKDQLESMLTFLSGWSPEAFAGALKAYGNVCGLRADADNWCILPKGHDESHDAGEFTWDTAAELHTIAATKSAAIP